MENKDVEKKIKESYDQIEMEDFSAVWNRIKDNAEVRKPKKSNKWKIFVASAACLVVLLGILIPVILNNRNKPTTFFEDKLSFEVVTYETFTESLDFAGMSTVSFSDYSIVNCKVYSINNTTKGGAIEFVDDSNSPSYMATVKVYTKDVLFVDNEVFTPDYTHTVGKTSIQVDSQENATGNGLFVYDVRAVHNNIKYKILLKGIDEDIRPFLNEFFE